MRFLFVIFFSFSTLFMSGCWWEEEKRESITQGKTPKDLFLEAKDFSDQGLIDEAIKLYETVQAAYPASKYSIQSKLEKIYILYKAGRFDESIDELNSFIKLYPDHFSTPYAFYLRGLVAQSKTKSILDDLDITDSAQRDVTSVVDAFNYYLALIEKFPKSEYSIEAKSNLIPLRNALARHELYIAIYYTKREAYIGAINRLNNIIEKFPNTPSIPAALHLLIRNYEKIGALDLRDDAERVLKSSYPKYTPHYSLED